MAAQGSTSANGDFPPLPEESDAGDEAETTASTEDRLIHRLLQRLQEMGVTTSPPPPPRPREPQAEPAQYAQEDGDSEESWSAWHEWNWDQWHSHRSWQDWQPDSDKWKEDGKWDRPYLSHLEFPKFDGRKEEYAN